MQKKIELMRLTVEFMARISRAPAPAVDKAINDALALVGAFLQVDRSYVFEIREGGDRMDNTREWCAPGIEPQRHNLQDVPVDETRWWFNRLQRDDVINVPRVVDLPPEAAAERAVLEPQDILSVLAVPLWIEDCLLGFVGFDAVRAERTWSEDLVFVLRVLADALAGALLRQRTERALSSSRGLLRSVVDSAPDGIITVDANGRVVEYNQAAEAILGYSRAEILRQNVRLLVDTLDIQVDDGDGLPEMADLERLAAAIRIGDDRVLGRRLEVTMRRRDGAQLPLEIGVSSTCLPDGSRIITAHLRDITQRRLAHQEISEARNLAEQSAAAKQRFLATMSHEIRTPLNAVIGMGYLLADTPLNEEQAAYVKSMRFSADLLLVLINDILDFSKIEEGHVTFEATPFQLDELIVDLIGSLRGAARERGLDLRVETAANLPEWVAGDSSRLKQVLLNLVSNAIKFTEHGSVTLAVALESADHQSTKLKFTVQDTGIGIARENLTRIFQPFTQERGDTARHFGGTGLGLAIVWEIVTRQGGNISVHSEVGRGSRFEVKLDFQTISPSGYPLLLPELPSLTGTLEGLNVLLVEDNEINQVVASRTLRRMGAQVKVAASGEKALSLFALEAFDVILMDIHMPGMDGYETTMRIRELSGADSALRIIALTGSNLHEDSLRAEACGMDGFIMKPFDPQTLSDRIRAYLCGTDLSGHRIGLNPRVFS